MIVLSGVLLVASAGLAQAQDTTPANPQAPATSAPPATAPTLGTIDFGFRGDSFTGDQARYNRLRDLQQGAYLDKFRYAKETESQYFRAEAYRVGYEDQRYLVRFDEIGKFKATFDYNSNPLYQAQAKNLFTYTGNGVATVSDTVQTGLQNGTLTQLQAMQQYTVPSDIKTNRQTSAFNAVYSASRELDFKVNVRDIERSGNNLQSFVFGSSPGNAVVLDQGVPVSDRTTDVKTQAEWANREAMLAIGYNVSWYNQNNSTFTWDNPLRLTDSATAGPAFGRTSLFPTNSANTFNVTGSAKLAGHSRVMAALSYGTWDQNQALLPNTANPLLVSNPLERPTAEAKADITSGILGFSSRPLRDLFFTAKYRYYDYANKTPVFTNMATVADYAAGTLEESEPASIKRQTFDFDTSYSPFKYLGFDGGYSRENDDRTFRVVPHSSEDTFRVSADSTGNQYVTARVKYEYSKRRGATDPSALPDSEQSQMVQFDVAPRDRKRRRAADDHAGDGVRRQRHAVFTITTADPDTYSNLRDNRTRLHVSASTTSPNAKFSAGAPLAARITALVVAHSQPLGHRRDAQRSAPRLEPDDRRQVDTTRLSRLYQDDREDRHPPVMRPERRSQQPELRRGGELDAAGAGAVHAPAAQQDPGREAGWQVLHPAKRGAGRGDLVRGILGPGLRVQPDRAGAAGAAVRALHRLHLRAIQGDDGFRPDDVPLVIEMEGRRRRLRDPPPPVPNLGLPPSCTRPTPCRISGRALVF
jgi:MtrB/PioB family decaheme-associated outer membrane protein